MTDRTLPALLALLALGLAGCGSQSAGPSGGTLTVSPTEPADPGIAPPPEGSEACIETGLDDRSQLTASSECAPGEGQTRTQ